MFLEAVVEVYHILENLIKRRLQLQELVLLKNLIHLIMQKHPHVKDVFHVNQLVPMQYLLIITETVVDFLYLLGTVQILIDTLIRLGHLNEHGVTSWIKHTPLHLLLNSQRCFGMDLCDVPTFLFKITVL